MRKSGIAAMIALASVVGAPASAEDGDPPADMKERLICKSEAVTGSRLKKRRICLTRQQWDDLAASTKQDLDRFTNGLTSTAPAGGNPATPQ